MSFAKTEDSPTITENIYKSDNRNQESINMDDYHRQIYRQQLEENQKRRIEVQKRVFEMEEERRAREQKEQERQKEADTLNQKYYWDNLKDDWYWGDYNENLQKTSYSDVDNYLDNLKPERYEKVKLSDRLKKIGDFKEAVRDEGKFINRSFVYKTPYREYVYDLAKDRMIPNSDKFVTKNNILNPFGNCSLKDKTIKELVDIKHKGLDKLDKVSTAETKNELKESFENVDPRLVEIYQRSNQKDLDNNIKQDSWGLEYLSGLVLLVIIFILCK